MNARDTPTATADTPPWTTHTWTPPPDPHTGLLELAEWETEAMWHDGYQAALADIAARHTELDRAWRAAGRIGYEQRIAARITDMATYAAAAHIQHGTREWAGLDNGAALPTADWGTTTMTLREVA